LNTQTKTLHFLTNIYTTPLSLEISAWDTPSSSVDIISFLLLENASVDNNIKCAEYDWAVGENDKKEE
jgi:hypothetical protein